MKPKNSAATKERQENSRKNGTKGRGPQTPSGLLRSSQNARRHGLSVAISQDPSLAPNIDKLAELISGNSTDPHRIALARQVSEAQLDLFRIRIARRDILADEKLRAKRTNKKDLKLVSKFLARRKQGEYAQFSDVKAFTITELEKALEEMLEPEALVVQDGIGLIIGKLNVIERYEKRALSKRNKALRDLADYDEQRALGLPWP